MRLRLGTKFSATIAGILAFSIVSSLLALFAAWRVDQRLEQAHREELPSEAAGPKSKYRQLGFDLVPPPLLPSEVSVDISSAGGSQGISTASSVRPNNSRSARHRRRGIQPCNP